MKMREELAVMVLDVEDCPTVAQIDEMLALMSRLTDQSLADQEVIDKLLDLRSELEARS